MIEGKVAIVTGAGSGIGRATALAFAHQGVKVVVADIATENGKATVEQINEDGGEAAFIQTNVMKADDVKAMVNFALTTYGRLDYAHNNAGISGDIGMQLADCSEEEWDQLIGVNLKGVWLSMKYEILHMMVHGGGAIVNTSSIAGLQGSAAYPIYSAAKHGVVGLTKAASKQYASHKIRINAVCPGIIETPIVDQAAAIIPNIRTHFAEATPLGRIARPSEVANAVVWLCSDQASFVTGVAMPIDGGWVASL